MDQREQAMMERIPPLARFEASPIRELVMCRLRELQPNEIAPYDELRVLTGEDPQASGRGLIYRARQKLIAEGIVTEIVIGVGVKRMGEVGKVDVANGHLGRSRNAVKRASKTVRAVRPNELPPKEQSRYLQTIVNIGIHQHFYSRKAQTKLAQLSQQGLAPAELKKMLQASVEGNERRQPKKPSEPVG
jgi:hypothetical protein